MDRIIERLIIQIIISCSPNAQFKVSLHRCATTSFSGRFLSLNFFFTTSITQVEIHTGGIVFFFLGGAVVFFNISQKTGI